MQLDNFLQFCRSTPGVSDVIVDEITDSMLAQIVSKNYTLSERPVLFKFVLPTASVNIIIPHELWDNLESIPKDDLLQLVERIENTHQKCISKNCVIYDKNTAIYFIRPDTQRTYCLVGRSIDPLDSVSPVLNDLLNSVKTIPNITDAVAYNVVEGDPAVFIVCDVQGSTEKTETIVPESVYNDPESHNTVCETLRINVEELLK